MQQNESGQRELFKTRTGFILAAVGSAVGLGNMWRFPYVAAEGGGAAFVFLYIILTLAIGIPLMLSEFSIGRGAKLSPIGALRKVGGRGWSLLGFMYVITGFIILAYYSVIAGWVVRYAVDGIFSGFPANPAEHFGVVTTGMSPIWYHLVVMGTTIFIVSMGVQKGIERAAIILMPVLFGILVLLALWAFTLDGALEGYAFYLRPSFSELFDPDILSQAAGQAFYSLSLGMGCMLTFSSYLSDDINMNREATTIAFSDFGVAFIAGLVVFPVIFALGMQNDVSESTVGALFIALPGAFVAMGAMGRVVGILFFIALIVGAVTSAVSLLEVVTSSVIDEFKLPRKPASIAGGVLIALLGLLPASSLSFLSVIDRLAEAMLALGAFFMAIFVGWVAVGAADELRKGASERSKRMVPLIMTAVRFILPPVILFATVYAFIAVWTTYLAEFGG
ncbi:MAG: sodium-dependent transporter [Longimicrobiales bacterium]|nr:sodium-dependent transporter [Longimicrobiales bacterium]